MPKGKEEKVEEASEETKTEEETQTRTFTQEELDAEREKARQEELGKYQGIQRTIAKKDGYIKQLEERLSYQPSTPQKGTDDTLLTLLKEQFGDDPRIVRAIEEREVANTRAWMESQTAEARSKIMQKIIDAGEDPEDPKYFSVWDATEIAYLKDGKFDRAEKRLERILPKAEKSVEVEPDETQFEEKYRKWLEVTGRLTSDTAGPSASSSHYADLRDRYVVDPGSLSPAERTEYLRLRAERGVFNP